MPIIHIKEVVKVESGTARYRKYQSQRKLQLMQLL